MDLLKFYIIYINLISYIYFKLKLCKNCFFKWFNFVFVFFLEFKVSKYNSMWILNYYMIIVYMYQFMDIKYVCILIM